MASNTATALVVLGALLLLLLWPSLPWSRWCIRLGAGLVALVALLHLLELIFNMNLGSERWLFQLSAETFQGLPTNRMARETALTLFCASLTMLLITAPRRPAAVTNIAGFLAVVVVSLGLIFLLGYLFGSPFFSGEASDIPMAVNTALAFVFLGVGLVATVGPDFPPLRQFMGPSVDARLLRVFLPFTALTACVVAWSMHLVSNRPTFTAPALVASMLVVVAIFVVSIICAHIARLVGGDLERAGRALQEAEKQSRAYAADLRALNLALEERVAQRTAALEQSRDHLEQFFSITTSLQNPDNVDRTLDLALHFCQRLGYEWAMLSLVDQEAKVIRGVKAVGSLANIVPTTVRPLDSDDILAIVAREGRTVVVADSTQDQRCDQAAVTAAGVCGQIIVPLANAGEVVGTLQVASRTPLHPTAEEVRTLETLGGQAARALYRQLRIKEIHRLNQKLEQRNQQLQELADNLAASVLAEHQAQEALREAEERTRKIVDTAHDAFVAMDSEGRITDWNRQAELTFGWPRAEVLGRLLEEMIVPEQYREAHRQGLKRFLATGEAPVLNKRIELTALHREGRVFPVELTITALPWRESYVFSSFLHDITERKKAEEALKRTAAELTLYNQQLHKLAADLRETAASEFQAHQKLKKAQSQLVQSEKLAALGQLVAGVAHEINNPLSFVSNNVAVLQRDVRALRDLLALYQEAEGLLKQLQPELAARIDDLAQTIDLKYTLENLDGLMTRSRDGLKRIQQIVKDLRDFARLDESDLQDIDLNAGIESTINIIRGQAKKQQVTLDLQLEPLPPVTCYPAKINQVVLNLVANAIDACSAGGKVTVSTHAEPKEVEIAVADTGSGIDPAIRERIFDPFFTTKPQGKGTGLGLSISYGIVQDHGGRIEVDSTPGQGSNFRVRLPRRSPRDKTAR
jgi:PAS domain S-box-containing protein